MNIINGFSKFSKVEKISYLTQNYFQIPEDIKESLKSFWHPDEEAQKIFDEFSENTLTNFYFPYGVVPNMKINGQVYCVPMVIEESSVVAACSKSAKFWLNRGGFKAEVKSTTKIGQVHFDWSGEAQNLVRFFELKKQELLKGIEPFTENMNRRGGGVLSLKLIDKTHIEPNYFQLFVEFETCDAMGANFINTVLEALGQNFKMMVESDREHLPAQERFLTVIMAILSNYTPECLVSVEVSCPIEDLKGLDPNLTGEEYAYKFAKAVRIAEIDVNRATTHNKGIFNGIDSVILATGNDFRAVEACGHTYASKNGKYESLTHVDISDGQFRFWMDLPLAVGTVGGLTALHPLAKISLEMLGNPGARELMQITASIGLAQNFGALNSLVTTGIQKGHMKMHLMNILNHLNASEKERELAKNYFKEVVISFNAVRDFIHNLRNLQ